MAFPENEKGFAVQDFMDERPMDTICASINHRFKKNYDVSEIHAMIVEGINEDVNNQWGMKE